MLKRASMRPRATVLLVATILTAALLYLLGNNRVSLWDRDEPRYAQCSWQMLDGYPGPKGAHAPGWVVPHFLDDLRTEKPPLIYWCQAASMKVFGKNDFAARFPSALGMTLVLTLLAVVLYRAIGPVRAVWAVFIMATSGLTIMSAKMCLTDAVLLLWIVIAQICTFAVYRGNRSWLVTAILWTALGLGGLTKGPIVLAVIGMTLVVLFLFDFWPVARPSGAPNMATIPAAPEGAGSHPIHYFSKSNEAAANEGRGLVARLAHATRWWLALRPWIGILIIAVITGPWLLLVHQREPTFLHRLFAAAQRHLSTAGEKHTSPPGYYLTMIWGLFFPWSLLLPTTLVIAWRNRHLPTIRFCLATIIGVWVFHEIMKTKLPFYMLPTFPAFALLTGDALVRCIRRQYDDLLRPAFMIAVVIWSVAALAMGGAPWLLMLPKFGVRELVPVGATAILTLVAVIYAVTVFRLFQTRRLAPAAIAMGIGVALLFGLLFTAYLPHAEYLNTSKHVAAILRLQPPAPGDAIMIEYKEPSLAWYEGGTVVEERMMRFLDDNPPEKWPTWIVLPRTVWEKTRPETRDKLEVVGDAVHGVNYAGKIDGKQIVAVIVVRKR